MKATTRQRKQLDLTVKNYSGDFIPLTLSGGRKVKLRSMIGKDFIFIERDLKDMGDTERSFKLIERLSVEPDNITYVEILDLTSEDIQTLTEGLAEANGVKPEEEE